MSKRTYWWNPETQQIEEITEQPREVVHGTVWGGTCWTSSEREGLCPIDDYKDTWAKKETERKRIRGELPPTPQMREERRQRIADAYDKVKAGYKPKRMPWLD